MKALLIISFVVIAAMAYRIVDSFQRKKAESPVLNVNDKSDLEKALMRYRDLDD